MKIDLQQYPPVIYQDQEIIYLANGNITMGFRVTLPEVYSLSEKDFEDLHGSWNQAFKNLPSGTIVHKQDIYLKTRYKASSISEDTFLGRATSEYFDGREYLEHQSYLFFTWPLAGSLHRSVNANPFMRIPGKVPSGVDQKGKDFVKAVTEAVEFLNNIRNIHLMELAQGDAYNLTSNYFNGFNPNSQTDMVLDVNLHIGNNNYGVLAINNEQCFNDIVTTSKSDPLFTSGDISFHQGFIDALGLRLHENHIVNQVIVLDDRSRWIQVLNKKREELQKSIQFGTRNKEVLGRIENILAKVNEDDQARIIRGQFNIIYWDKDPAGLERIQSNIHASFKDLDIRPYEPKGKQLHKYYLYNYFGFTTSFSNTDFYVSDLKHALCLWLNNSNYRNDQNGILFNDRLFNIPVFKDVWDAKKRRIKARNFAIFAPTGEGKSFLANNILRQFFEMGTHLVIIDLGGSYSKFAKLYPDDHIILRYEHGQNLGINPFYIKDRNDLSPQHVEDLTAFLLELSATGLKVAKETQVALKKVLLAYYRNTSANHSLQSFYEFLVAYRNKQDQAIYFDAGHFLHILSEYVDDGMYSFLFATSKDESYMLEDKHMIIFELDEVKDNREILSIMLKLIKSAIQRTIWKNRSERGIILFDEFAKQLKFDNVLESVEFYYQAIRKQNGSIGIVLQSINQLPDNATSASILENTQIIYSLHNEKGYEALRKRLNLSSHDLNQLNSIRNQLSGARRYTEIFIKIGRESNIFRLEVPPAVYAAYLTDGDDSEVLSKLYKKHQSMEKAIEEFLSIQSKT